MQCSLTLKMVELEPAQLTTMRVILSWLGAAVIVAEVTVFKNNLVISNIMKQNSIFVVIQPSQI